MVSKTGGDKIRDKVADIIAKDRQDLVDLCLQLGAISSPAGHERECGQAVVDWFKVNGIDAFLQPITEDSANAIGFIPGSGGGASLVCDAHIDVGAALPLDASEAEKRIATGWVDGDMIYGTGIINCKAQVAAFMMAARALKKAGVRLKGDLHVAGVAFETGAPSVDEFQGVNYPGEGFGSRWLIDRGIVPDYALIGETSEFGVVASECGYMHLKVSVKGRNIYTPRLMREAAWKEKWQEHTNAFIKASHVVLALEEWAIKYEQRERMEFYGGVIVPKSQVIGMRGGRFGATRDGSCDIYMDIWLVPGKNPLGIKREVQDLVRGLGVDTQITMYHWGRGYIAKNAEPLIDAVKDAHRHILGTEPQNPPPHVLSMWRDLNMFNEVGIPSVCYGAPRQRGKEVTTGQQDRAMLIPDLVSACKIYALTMMSICGVAEA